MTHVPRRTFLGASALTLAAAGTARARDFGPNAEPVRYPEPDVVVLEKRFAKYKIGNTPILRLHTGCLWAEGCAWNGWGRYVVWSDIPNDIQMRWLDEDGHVSTMRKPAGYSNGNTFDFEGRQLSAEHGNRRVVRYEPDGKTTVIADKFEGKPLNGPNDVVVHPDGGIWFTDPGYGTLLDYEGHKGTLEIKEAVYRVDPRSGAIEKVTDELGKPNGICFSPDYKRLYVCDTGASHYPNLPKVIKSFDVSDGRKLGKAKAYASMTMNGKAGFPDGIRCDTDGNVWCGTGWVGPGYDGVHVFAPDGQRIGLIRLPETAANVTFGGPKRNRLFIVASQSLYAVYVEARGAHIC